jgi:hypothetical protein
VAGLEESIPGRDALGFRARGTDWRAIYESNGRPVILERPLGRGTVVIVGSGYVLSNEALRAARRPGLLAWLVGPNRVVIFEETHLGVEETPGVAALVRRFRLHGVVIALLGLAALFLWRRAAPLQSASADGGAGEDRVAGRDAASGLVHLLRRHVTPKTLLTTCVSEWKRSRADRPARDAATAKEEAADREAASAADPVAGYRAIARVLADPTKPASAPPVKGAP